MASKTVMFFVICLSLALGVLVISPYVIHPLLAATEIWDSKEACFIVVALWVWWVLRMIVKSAVESALQGSGGEGSIETLTKEIYELQAQIAELEPMAEAFNKYRYSDEACGRELYDAVHGKV